MKFRKDPAPPVEEDVPPDDPTSFLVDSPFAEFVLLNTYYIKIMVMLGYTFMHGAFFIVRVLCLIVCAVNEGKAALLFLG